MVYFISWAYSTYEERELRIIKWKILAQSRIRTRDLPPKEHTLSVELLELIYTESQKKRYI